jgi:polar amino acid transport system substrate-binding protein
MKLILILIFLITSQISFALTDAELKKTLFPNNRTINLTGHPDYPPVVWQEKGSRKLVGIAVKLLERAFSEINVKLNVINTDTWGRAQVEVAEGKIDILMPPYLNDERLKVYSYPKEPFLMDDTVIFVKKGHRFKFDKLDDLIGKTGVAIIHDSFGSEFDTFEKKSLKVTRLPKSEHSISFLLKGRAKYMVGGYNAVLAVASKMGVLDQVEVLPHRIIVTGMYTPISRISAWNSPELLSYLDRKVLEYKKEGYIKKLEEKYLKIYKAEASKEIEKEKALLGK